MAFGLRSKTFILKPFLRILDAMGLPMLPTPMNPTETAMVSSFCSVARRALRSWRRPEYSLRLSRGLPRGPSLRGGRQRGRPEPEGDGAGSEVGSAEGGAAGGAGGCGGAAERSAQPHGR